MRLLRMAQLGLVFSPVLATAQGLEDVRKSLNHTPWENVARADVATRQPVVVVQRGRVGFVADQTGKAAAVFEELGKPDSPAPLATRLDATSIPHRLKGSASAGAGTAALWVENNVTLAELLVVREAVLKAGLWPVWSDSRSGAQVLQLGLPPCGRLEHRDCAENPDDCGPPTCVAFTYAVTAQGTAVSSVRRAVDGNAACGDIIPGTPVIPPSPADGAWLTTLGGTCPALPTLPKLGTDTLKGLHTMASPLAVCTHARVLAPGDTTVTQLLPLLNALVATGATGVELGVLEAAPSCDGAGHPRVLTLKPVKLDVTVERAVGGLKTQPVSETVRTLRHALGHCVDVLRVAGGEPPKQFRFSAKVTPTGSVLSARLDPADSKLPGACVENAVKQARFPKAARGTDVGVLVTVETPGP